MKALLQQALEALSMPCDRWNAVQHQIVSDAIKALNKELEKPEPEPVAWRLAHRFYSSQRDAEYAWKNECVFLGTSYVPEPL